MFISPKNHLKRMLALCPRSNAGIGHLCVGCSKADFSRKRLSGRLNEAWRMKAKCQLIRTIPILDIYGAD